MKRKQGFTLVEIMIVVAIIGLLAAIGIPSFMKARETSRKNACINNLRQIDSAKEQWAMAENKTDEEPAAGDLDEYIKGGEAALICPSDSDKTFATSYSVNAVGTAPACQIDATNHAL